MRLKGEKQDWTKAYKIFGLVIAFQLSLATSDAAELFDCVIEPSITVRIGGQVSGLLEAVMVDRGDMVKAGQVIAQLNASVEEATVTLMSEQAENSSEVEAQRFRWKLADSRAKRATKLFEKKINSRDRMEESISQMEVTRREMAVAEIRQRIAILEYHRAKEILELKKIRSPIDGMIVDRHLFQGEFLDQEGNFVTIARLDPLHVEAFLPVKYFKKIQLGMAAVIIPNQPVSGTFTGNVAVVDKVFDAASGTFGVRVTMRNPDLLLPAGHRCSISFEGVDK